ncbi:hypothetical protein M422DRAFT_260780 [Sphaerobolus stellatus SS14]|uniref:Aminoglycoside phosphotransferase domain-containing protein n=1 Tax=Sphaerobolus stellatus (strain SS14) TaxID=990650 RepID=A0A0C9VH59_SPHS4|nr:hypothetical protein M422DRAFT_260780 [Sphaerobolus stellatus SS14]
MLFLDWFIAIRLKESENCSKYSAMIPYFTPLEAYTSLVFQHPDLALRNVSFDENDFTKITGVVDWGGAQILPLILTAHFLGDLLSTGNDPCSRPDYPDEAWRTVLHDWTSLGDTSLWPKCFRSSDEPVDLSPIGATMIKRYHFRQYFGACFSRHMTELHGNTDLSHAIVFKDATYYLKFHEVIISGNAGSYMRSGSGRPLTGSSL